MDTKGNPQQEVIETENNALGQAAAMNSMLPSTNFVSEFNKHEMEKYWAEQALRNNLPSDGNGAVHSY